MNAAAPLRGRYEFVKPLGQGGFGHTSLFKYLGLPSQPLRVVKQFKPQFSEPAALGTALHLFDQEARILEQLGRTHDQIPELFEHLEENGEFYLIQEYIAGESLEQILTQKSALPEPEVIDLLVDILQVLAFVHDRQVIHRDVTPSNLIQRQSDGRIVLIDFGAVKEVIQTGIAKLTIPIGKPGYIPAEQSAGNPRFCSDIYAVGMIGIQSLTGSHPLSLSRDLATGAVHWLEKTSISPRLGEILTRMVQPDCHQRYQSAAAVLTDLRPLQRLPNQLAIGHTAHSAPSVMPATLPPPPRPATVLAPPVSAHQRQLGKWLGWSLGAACLLLAGIAAYRWARPPVLGCPLADLPSGNFTYSGSTTWAPLREIDAQLGTLCPQFKLTYKQPSYRKPGSGAGIELLLNGQIDFAQSSRQPNDTEFQIARNRGTEIREIPIAIDGIAIAVNPSLAIPGLTIAQIQAIYTGRFTNWQEVGGPNLPIVAYSRKSEDSGTVDYFVEAVLEKQPLGKTVQLIATTTAAVQKIATDPGGIYYGSAPEVVGQCTIKPVPIGNPNQWIAPYQGNLIAPPKCSDKHRNRPNLDAFRDGKYPLSRRLFVIVKKNGQITEQAGEAYAKLLLTPQAQELIEQAGFVRIH